MPERNWGCRVSTDHGYKGLRMAVLENELLRVSLLLDKGGDIVEFQHKPSGTDFMWWTPWGLQRLGKMVPSSAMAEGAFGDYYEGGWQEIFPNGGAPSTHRGMQQGLHGEASLLPWEPKVVEDSPEQVTLELETHTYRSPFRLRKRLTMKRGQAALFATCEATNLSDLPMDAMWGQHPSFGSPFLGPDTRLDLAGGKLIYDRAGSAEPRFSEGARGLWPKLKGNDGKLIDLSRFPKPGRASQDMFYLADLKGDWFALTNSKSKAGFGLCWDKKAWPYLWMWLVFHGLKRAPLWGRSYNIALEPFSSMPGGLANAAKAGTQLIFKPRQTKRAWFTAVAYGGRTRVGRVTRSGRVA